MTGIELEWVEEQLMGVAGRKQKGPRLSLAFLVPIGMTANMVRVTLFPVCVFGTR